MSSLFSPWGLARRGAVEGATTGALLGLIVLAPVLTAALGAAAGAALGTAAGAAGAGIAGSVLDAGFVREVSETLEPGRAALFVVGDALDPDRVVELLKPLSPRVLRSTLSASAERRLLNALTDRRS
jgi:uncharacterized membrane protein